MAEAQPVETYAILPIAKFRAMQQRLEKSESETRPEQTQTSTEEEPLEVENGSPTTSNPSQEPAREKKDIKLKYRKVQIKKLLQHIERLEGSQDITSLENIDQLIQSALGSSKKIIPHELKFFTFLFDNNLAHFVKNRWKIGLYYKDRDNWFQI